jgi:hypothetical protein
LLVDGYILSIQQYFLQSLPVISAFAAVVILLMKGAFTREPPFAVLSFSPKRVLVACCCQSFWPQHVNGFTRLDPRIPGSLYPAGVAV